MSWVPTVENFEVGEKESNSRLGKVEDATSFRIKDLIHSGKGTQQSSAFTKSQLVVGILSS